MESLGRDLQQAFVWCLAIAAGVGVIVGAVLVWLVRLFGEHVTVGWR